MNILKNSLQEDILRKVKPLIILYLEDFSIRDIKTRKPVINEERLLELKNFFLKEGLDDEDWKKMVLEFDSVKVSMESRSFLKLVKSDPDWIGNVYSEKQKILSKISDILGISVER